MISDDKIAEIRQAARISEFISPHVALKRRGRSLLGLCPFHNEKSPSFSVDDDRGFYHCFGCSAGGNVFTFLMEHERLTFPEAVRKVASHYGIEVPDDSAGAERRDPSFYEINASAARYYRRFLVETEHGQRFREYLAERGIGDEVAETFSVGAASPSGTGLARWLAREGIDLRKAAALGLLVDRGGTAYDRFRDRLMFPIRDSQGRVIGFGGRQMGDGDGPKYLNSPESVVYQKNRALYGIYEARDALRHAETVLLVEGYVDVIALHQAGVSHTVATCGTALTSNQLRMIRRHAAEVVTFFDGDSAGRRAAARNLPLFVEEGLWPRGVSLPEGEDPDTFVRKAGVEALRDRIKNAVPLATVYAEQVKETTGLSLDGLSRVGAELAGIVARVTDEYERDFLLRKVAYAAGLSEEVLRRKADRVAGGSGRGEAQDGRSANTVGQRRGGAPGPEELVVTALLADHGLAPVLAERGVVERMEESLWRELSRDIIDAVREGRVVDSAEALSRLPEFWRNRIASRLLEDTFADRAIRARVMEDCIRRIEEAARRRHNETLLGNLRKTEQIRSGEIPHETLTGWRPRTSSDA